ncbi:hypothetical protein MJ561_12000 [Klebsiella pneumoniae]|nr:hypothetical protein MJ561_12000 [Klebsiella pneumoniae]
MFHQGRGGLRNRVHRATTILCKTTALSARGGGGSGGSGQGLKNQRRW